MVLNAKILGIVSYLVALVLFIITALGLASLTVLGLAFVAGGLVLTSLA